jgi:hypothetical protein
MRPQTNANKNPIARSQARRTLLTLLLFLATTTTLQAQSHDFIAPVPATTACASGSVPIEFRDGLALVRLSINQKTMTFIIDSAGVTVINSDHLSLPFVTQIRTGIITASTAEPLQPWNVVDVKSLRIGSVEVRDSQVLSRSMRPLEARLGQQLDGILGTDILQLWDSVSLNYKGKALTLNRAVCTTPKKSDPIAHSENYVPFSGKSWH